MGSTWAP